MGQSSSKAPIVLAADKETFNVTFAGDTRYAPPSLAAAAAEKNPAEKIPRDTSSQVQTIDYRNPSDASSVVPASGTAFVSDAGGGSPMDYGATHSIDQRDAGPARRWSIYGTDPRYPTPTVTTLP
ncbi:MAG TPA: hypothetical protein VGJ04_12070, partial [Pirellulales bacterium]